MRTPIGGSQRGAAAVELVLVTPVLIVLLLFVVAGGRLADARAQVDAAARDAARAGTLARSAAGAERAGKEAADSRLHDAGVECRSLLVQVDATRFAPGGTVAATVTCTVDLGDLTLLAVPGSRSVTATAAEPVDVYRGVRR